MSDILRSVGLDVGTTSTQMIFSELTVENKASGFAVPEMEIARRDIRYRSPVYFTPLLDESHVDAGALRELVAEEYRKAGIRRESVDTGAIIITGETSRKENARAVLDALSDFAGAVSYTHLDVYKRQLHCRGGRAASGGHPPGAGAAVPGAGRRRMGGDR